MEPNAKVVAEESYLRIWVGCARGVLNADKKGKSDPYAVLTTRDLGSSSGKSIELHRTRVIDDSLDPNFNEWCTFLMPPSWSNALKKLQQRQNDKVNDDDVASKGSVSNDGDNYDDRYPDNIEINIALYDYDEVLSLIEP
jgi:Ca2+-dependent lipid-binding protein